jgi:8-oxo-dGTP pyrophosphatase MutT (NUDIX family)
MSALFDRIGRLYREGHQDGPAELFFDPRLKGGEVFRPAAVLVALTEREEPGVLLIHRPSNMRAHPGQIAFPGGKIDPGETPVDAALREAREELGIDSAQVRVVGTSDLYRTGSGYEITPVLGVVPPDIEIRPNPTEVAQWFEAPARHVFDPANHVQKFVEYEGMEHPFYEIVWQDHAIWGVTAALIVNLSRRMRRRD